MAQTTYSRTLTAGIAGQLGDTRTNTVESFINDEGDAIPAGIAVTLKSEGKIEEFDAADDTIAGIVVNSFSKRTDTLSGSDAIAAGDLCNVLTEGVIRVAVEETVAVGDPVFARCTSDGASNTQLGKFRNDSDSGKCRQVKGARFLTAGSTTTPPLMAFSAAVEAAQGDTITLAQTSHAQVTGDTGPTHFIKTSPTRHFKVEAILYNNPTGLAADGSNYFAVQVKNGSTVVGSWSTLTGAEGTIAADTYVSLTLNATNANLVLAPGTTLDLLLDETGTATLPAGILHVIGRYL